MNLSPETQSSVQTGIDSVTAPSWRRPSSDRFSFAPDTQDVAESSWEDSADKDRSAWPFNMARRLKAYAQPRGGSPAPRQAATLSKLTLRSVCGGAKSRRKFLGALPSWVRPTFSFSSYTLAWEDWQRGCPLPSEQLPSPPPQRCGRPPEPRWGPGFP